jgi:RimJ/RimL family protein N-acetyltransferase
VPVTVCTDDVISLREWVAEDAAFLQDASRDAAIQRYSLSRSEPFTAQEAVDACELMGLAHEAEARPVGPLVIMDAETGAALGQCGIDGWSAAHVAQIGYWLAPVARGRGVATRAVVVLTDWLFTLGASSVFLTVVADNECSLRVAQRAGFQPTGPTGKQSAWQGVSHEVLGFAVMSEEWRARHS